MSLRVVLPVAALAALAGCVGSTTPAPTRSTTTITAADVGPGTLDRDAALARAERRLVVAAREIGVLQRELSRHRPDVVRPERDLLRRAEEERAALERDLSRLSSAPASSWSPAQHDALETRLDELDVMLERARK